MRDFNDSVVLYLIPLGYMVLGGATPGFIARDILQVGQPAVGTAWLLGAMLGLWIGIIEVRRRRDRSRRRGVSLSESDR